MAVQPTISCDLGKAAQVADIGDVDGEGIPEGGRSELIPAVATAIFIEIVGNPVPDHAGTR